MPRGTHLTEEEKGRILAFHECSLSIQKIASKLNRSRHVISNFLKNRETYGQNKTGGPRKKVTPRMERLIRNSASNSMASLDQIKADLQLTISRSTIHRVLTSSIHLKRQKLKVAPRLLPRHKEARLNFAKLNMNTDWKSVRIISNIALISYQY